MHLLETIHIVDGKALNLAYHQRRFNASRHTLGYSSSLTLELDPPREGEYRCRIVYEKKIETIEYIPYQKKTPQSFKLVHSEIDYPLKYADRNEIETLFKQKGEADEIIIIKDSLVTDTSIANLCFFDGKEWVTPEQPLLKGTTRQRFLDERRIKCADINYKEIPRFSKIAVMNAMTDFTIIENAIIS